MKSLKEIQYYRYYKQGGKMKISKCPKTATGQHIWNDCHIIKFNYKKIEYMGTDVRIKDGKRKWYRKCILCGLIDDTKVIRKKKKKKKKMISYYYGKRIADMDRESLLAIIDEVVEELEKYRKARL